MLKSTRRRLAAVALAGALLGTAGVASTATVAPNVEQASATAAAQYCNWPYKAAIQWRGGNAVAYSPGGAWLGGKNGSPTQTLTWYTPWEDVRFVTYTGTTYSLRTWCY